MRISYVLNSEPLANFTVKHTPGPWYPSYTGGAVCSVNLPVPHINGAQDARHYGGYLICESASTKADIALISIAPDMYCLLRRIHDWLEVRAVGQEALSIQVEIQRLFFDTWQMGARR